MSSSSSIRPLPAEAVAQIKSTIAITSLNVVVIELLKNSLDARAQKIEIAVEYSRGNCTVEDDGLGILPAEFKESGGLGKFHYSSKYDSTDVAYGCRGSFLASLAALSLVSITSHHHLYRSHNSMSISGPQVITRQIPAPPQQHIFASNHGTRVTVRDLFGNMPVRVKQRAIASGKQSGGGRNWEELQKWVTAIVLAWPSHLFLSIRNGDSSEKFQLRGTRQVQSSSDLQSEERLVTHVCSTLFRAALISSPDPSRWVYLTASASNISIKGALSTEPAPTKGVQFLSLGIHPLGIQHGRSFLREEINRIFEESSFGHPDDLPEFDEEEKQRRLRDRRYKGDGYTSKELRGSGKGIDKWPMFFIKIETHDSGRHSLDSGAEDLIDDKRGMLTSVMELLRVMVLEFLKKYHFRPKSNRLNGPSGNQNLAVERFSSSSYPRLHAGALVSDRDQSGTVDVGSPENSSVTSPLHEGTKGSLNKRPKVQPTEKLKIRRTESPFDGWSRVKIGVPRVPANIVETVLRPKNETNQGQFDALPSASSFISNIELRPNQNGFHTEMPYNLSPRKLPGLVANSGMITRPPFSDALLKPQEKFRPTSERDLSITKSNLDIEDDFVECADPPIKAKSFVSGRTDAIVKPSRTGRLTNPMSSWSILGNKNPSNVPENGTDIRDMSQNPKPSSWIDGIFKSWNNPVFRPAESNIPQVATHGLGGGAQTMSLGHGHSCSQIDINRAFLESSASLMGKISKHALRQAEVISQVDKKFILMKISNGDLGPKGCGHKVLRDTLVLVDQHAADERCRVEKLLADLCTQPVADSPLGIESPQLGIAATRLKIPITFAMSLREIQLLRTHSQHFADWGITYEFPSASASTADCPEYKVNVKTLPPGIVERCKAVPKVLAELLRSEAWNCSEKGPPVGTEQSPKDLSDSTGEHSWLRKIHSCPQAILDMLNSKSCRSAIMFNDELSNDQCKAIILRLADCAFPFQCAHGRPSMVPLVDLDALPQSQIIHIDKTSPDKNRFSVAFEAWKLDTKERQTI